jgi:hypothetical protein
LIVALKLEYLEQSHLFMATDVQRLHSRIFVRTKVNWKFSRLNQCLHKWKVSNSPRQWKHIEQKQSFRRKTDPDIRAIRRYSNHSFAHSWEFETDSFKIVDN